MSVLYVCDRCGRQSADPYATGWVKHLVTKKFATPVDVRNDLARNNDLCHACRESYEDWFISPEASPA